MELVEHVYGIDLREVINNPANFPDEVQAAAIDLITDWSRQIREAKVRLEGHLTATMKADNATKMVFISVSGEEKTATLGKGKMEACKAADKMYKKYGFPPEEIGEWEFKPSWSKAKEARKFGGDKQLVIDEIFQEGKEKLIIK